MMRVLMQQFSNNVFIELLMRQSVRIHYLVCFVRSSSISLTVQSALTEQSEK